MTQVTSAEKLCVALKMKPAEVLPLAMKAVVIDMELINATSVHEAIVVHMYSINTIISGIAKGIIPVRDGLPNYVEALRLLADELERSYL